VQTSRNDSVARWIALPILAFIVWFIALVVFTRSAGASSSGIFYFVLFLAAALFVVMCVGMAPSHRRVVAIVTLLAVTSFVVKCVPYSNIGLPFGYWVYPNRAIKAFLECPNVRSATLAWANYDADLEEFGLEVAVSATDGSVTTRQVDFRQYPTREYIAARVATIGCER
jgi:hypothetical protein